MELIFLKKATTGQIAAAILAFAKRSDVNWGKYPNTSARRVYPEYEQ